MNELVKLKNNMATQQLNRRNWLQRVGMGAFTAGITFTLADEAHALPGPAILAITSPQARKQLGFYKKGLLGAVHTLFSVAAISVKKLDEYTDTILGAEFGQQNPSVLKKQEPHYQLAAPFLPFQNELISPSQSIAKDFNLAFAQYMHVLERGKELTKHSDYNPRELVYVLTLMPRESIGKLVEQPIFPMGARLPVKPSPEADALSAVAHETIEKLKSDVLKKVLDDSYRIAYVRRMLRQTGDFVNGFGFDHKSGDPVKNLFWVPGASDADSLQRPVLLDRLLTNVLG